MLRAAPLLCVLRLTTLCFVLMLAQGALAQGALAQGSGASQQPARPAVAPTAPAPLSMPIVTLDQQALFSTSLFGKRALADLEAARAQLIAESDALAAELSAAERDLTQRRPGLSPEAFRDLATAFDARAEEVRRRQDAKDSALLRDLAAEQQRFFTLATPALSDLAREIGAIAILSPQAVLLTVGPIDITDMAVARLDAILGAGSGDRPPPPSATPAPAQP